MLLKIVGKKTFNPPEALRLLQDGLPRTLKMLLSPAPCAFVAACAKTLPPMRVVGATPDHHAGFVWQVTILMRAVSVHSQPP